MLTNEINYKEIGIEKLYSRLDTRWNSPDLIKQYIHRIKIEKICNYLEPGKTLLDVGRGGSVDGILGVYAAKKGLKVTISNVSDESIAVIKRFAKSEGVLERITFVKGHPEQLPFSDNSFEYVTALHILEHLSSMQNGLSEIHRITKRKAVIALPTCINFCAFSRLGGADYFKFSWKSPFAFFFGLSRIAFHIIKGDEGVDEIMEELGREITHTWRFPWKMRGILKEGGFQIKKFEPDALCLPWFQSLLPVMKFLDKYSHLPILRDCGLGSHAFLEKESIIRGIKK